MQALVTFLDGWRALSHMRGMMAGTRGERRPGGSAGPGTWVRRRYATHYGMLPRNKRNVIYVNHARGSPPQSGVTWLFDLSAEAASPTGGPSLPRHQG